jgi:ankyrin repeat protein
MADKQSPSAISSRRLPARPNLEHLKNEAKQHLKVIRKTSPKTKLTGAQLAIARAYGFASWRAMKAHVDARAAEPRAVPVPVPQTPVKRVRTADWKPIMDAALAGDVVRARRLLDAGADPNVMSTTNHRYRPLHRAIERKKTMPKHDGHDAVVKLLLERGGDPKLRATLGNITALQLAAMGETRFIPLLRDAFEPLDIFHAAALSDEKRVADLLKRDPGLASARDQNDYTALHYCSASQMYRESAERLKWSARIAKILIDAGADPMAAYNFGGEWPLRPLYFACGWSNNPAVAKVLLDAGADPCDNESVYHASDEGHQECLDLIEKYVDPKKLAKEASKCLPTQLHWRRTNGMKWLLSHGADPNTPGWRYGNTALHEAVSNGASEKVVRMLLDHGARPDVKNKQGKTALQLARASGKPAPVKLLSTH